MKHLLLLTAALVALPFAVAQRVVVKGSDTLGAKLVPMLKEAYQAQHPNVSFEIAAEGSSTGIAAVIDGTADIGMSSREAKATEVSAAQAKGVVLKPTTVAHDAMAVIVNANSPISKLTRRQVEQIFTGAVTDWSAVGGKPEKISIYTRNTSSGTYSDWKELAMNKQDYAPSSQKLAGNEQIATEVANTPGGIGYVGLAFINARGVKVVAIDGVLPTKEAVLAKKYPYARPTFYYTAGDPKGEVAKFVQFTLSPAGQQIAEKVGFVRLP